MRASAEKVELGVKVAYASNAGVGLKQLSQRYDIADAFGEIGKIESGDDLNVAGAVR